MNKFIIVALMAMGTSVPSFTSDVGIGLSVRSNDYAIYVPYKASDRIQLEGAIRYAHQNDENEWSGTTPEHWRSSTTFTTAGIGVFWLQPVGEKGRAYIGPRLTYARNENKSSSPGYSVSNKGDGYAIAPTIGYEYFPVKNVSLGGEVGLEYGRFNQSFTRDGINDSASHSSSSGTTSALILRVYF